MQTLKSKGIGIHFCLIQELTWKKLHTLCQHFTVHSFFKNNSVISSIIFVLIPQNSKDAKVLYEAMNQMHIPSLSLCTFLNLKFSSNLSITASLDGHYSFPKPINNRVSHLSFTLSLLLINGLKQLNSCHIHYYANDFILHNSVSFSQATLSRDI